MSEGTIFITPDKVYHHTWNGDIKEYEDKDINPEDLAGYAWNEVEFEGDVSLGRLISLLEASLDAWDILLQENIMPFIEESKKPCTPGRESDLEYLELYWGAESTIFEDKTTFSIWPSFHGVGRLSEDDPHSGKKKGEVERYAIEMTPVNELAHYPVRLNDKVDVNISDVGTFSRTGHLVPDKNVDLGSKSYTLLEVFKGIFWELTFMGDPERRDEMVEDLHETMQGLEDGTIETIPWDEVKDRLDAKKKELDEDSIEEGM